MIVNGNYRVIFRFDDIFNGVDASMVDYLDYH
ncbi:hypothetical protein [Bartonella sp. B1099]|nr:hypothetical protein [Bartonella sp. B1099]